MNYDQMKERCPNARFYGLALLSDHRLAITRNSISRGCGVADVVAEAGKKVWGVVYELSEHELGALDKSEGFRPGRERNSYWRRTTKVFVDGDDRRPIGVFTYFGTRQATPPPPNQAYKDLILSGARHWNLPSDYVCELEHIAVLG